jgi:sulfate permease
MIKIILLFILIVFFALNMGGANFSASFAAAYGGKVLSKKKAQFLFVLFVFLGAIMLGRPVAQTLGKK